MGKPSLKIKLYKLTMKLHEKQGQNVFKTHPFLIISPQFAVFYASEVTDVGCVCVGAAPRRCALPGSVRLDFPWVT